MKKVFALVRIVHGVDPMKISFDELCQLYAEANWYEHMKAELIAEKLSKFFQ